MTAPRMFWRLIRIGPRAAYALGLGPILGRLVLLLTTIGRRTGRHHVTPLLYAEVDGRYLVASARDQSADWIRNIAVDGTVDVRVGARHFRGRAEIIHDIGTRTAFLERQLASKPRMFRAILRLEGLPPDPSRADLAALSRTRAMVAISPLEDRFPA